MFMRKTTLALALGLLSMPAGAQEFSDLGGIYDCVIEPTLVVKLGSPVEGVIADILFKRGDQVTKGQVLAHIENTVETETLRMAEANANSMVDIEIARSRVQLLKNEVERKAILVAKDWNAKTVLEQAESELRQAELELQGARQKHTLLRLDRDRAKAQLERRTIRSPVDGVLLRRLIGPGEYVNSQAPIAQIAVIQPLIVDVFLPSELYNDVKVGDTATVEPAEPIGGSYQAQITVIDQVFDAASDTFGVRMELPNSDRELPAGVDCKLTLDKSS